jgi:hypothetical protein
MFDGFVQSSSTPIPVKVSEPLTKLDGLGTFLLVVSLHYTRYALVVLTVALSNRSEQSRRVLYLVRWFDCPPAENSSHPSKRCSLLLRRTRYVILLHSVPWFELGDSVLVHTVCFETDDFFRALSPTCPVPSTPGATSEAENSDAWGYQSAGELSPDEL